MSEENQVIEPIDVEFTESEKVFPTFNFWPGYASASSVQVQFVTRDKQENYQTFWTEQFIGASLAQVEKLLSDKLEMATEFEQSDDGKVSRSTRTLKLEEAPYIGLLPEVAAHIDKNHTEGVFLILLTLNEVQLPFSLEEVLQEGEGI